MRTEATVIPSVKSDAAFGGDADFYLEIAGDLYTATRREAESGHDERSGEYARAAEALTHVPEHLARAEARDEPPARKAKKKDEPRKKRERPEPPKEKRDRPEPKGDDLPPPLHL